MNTFGLLCYCTLLQQTITSSRIKHKTRFARTEYSCVLQLQHCHIKQLQDNTKMIQHCDHAGRRYMLQIGSRLIRRHVTSSLRLMPRLLGQPQSEMVTVDCVSLIWVNSGDTWLQQRVARILPGIDHINGGPTCSPLATGLSLIGESMSRERWWNANDRGETKLLGGKTCTTVTL